MSRTVFITGCSSGIGRATAKHFQASGWNVVATMRAPDKEVELSALERVLVARLDVQDEASIARAVDAGLARFGSIDVLVNNAGYGAYGPLEATSLEKARRQLDVNVLGLVATTQALLPHFRARRAGTIVNISSLGGRIAFPLGALYHGSKFAVEGISEALLFELAPLGVQVKLVEPGGTKTDFAGRSLDFSNDPKLVEYQPLVAKALEVLGPMLETGASPESVAAVIYEAATDGTSRLRYEASPAAAAFLAQRRALDDETFLGRIMAMFGIERPPKG